MKPELVYWWDQQHLRSEDVNALKEGEMHATLEVHSPAPVCEVSLWGDKLEEVWMCLLGKYFQGESVASLAGSHRFILVG